MEKAYEYVLYKKSTESYGDIITPILKTYKKENAIERMKSEALWLMTNEEYQNIKEPEPEDKLTIIKTGSRLQFYIEAIEIDFDGAPWATPKESNNETSDEDTVDEVTDEQESKEDE